MPEQKEKQKINTKRKALKIMGATVSGWEPF